MKKLRVSAMTALFVAALAMTGCKIFITGSNETDNGGNHTHTFADEWTSDETHHWHAATCGHNDQVKGKAEHTFGEWASNNDATKEADGTKSRTCFVCEHKETVTEEGTRIKIVDAKEGDIILSDGTNISADKLAEYTGTAKPAGIICKLNEDGKSGLMLGLYYGTDGRKKWTPENTTGCNTKFTEIICSASKDGGSYTFEGDLDGSDNWAEICKVDPEGTKDPATNYPAFNYALNYAKTAELEGTEYADGWYVPSIYELYKYVYRNKTELNAKLTAAGGTTLGRDGYWSSSQSNDFDDSAMEVDFYYGGVFGTLKYRNEDVCCLRAF